MLDEGRKVHDLLEDHPVDHLDVVVPHQARGAGGGEAGVGHLPSHAGVHHTGWAGQVRIGVYDCILLFI